MATKFKPPPKPDNTPFESNEIDLVFHCLQALRGWHRRMVAEYKVEPKHLMAALEAYVGMHEATAEDEDPDQ